MGEIQHVCDEPDAKDEDSEEDKMAAMMNVMVCESPTRLKKSRAGEVRQLRQANKRIKTRVQAA